MRKIFFGISMILSSSLLFAQTDSTVATPKKAPTVSLPRTSDHFVLQLGYTSWQGKPDSIKTGGLPRTFNVYFMLDFPFKTNPHWSTAVGAGIATDNVFFKKTSIGIKETSSSISFTDLSDTIHFKKYKLATAYAEAPIELRYRSNPDDDSKSFKVVVGAKVGVLLNAHTKGKNLESSTGSNINSYTEKLNSKRFFNSNRISLAGRIGYGHLSLFTSYQLTPLFKEGQGPVIRPMTVGLTISGL
jgi:hypothetical protein